MRPRLSAPWVSKAIRSISADHWFDFRYKIDTNPPVSLDSVEVASDNKDRGTTYRPIRMIPMRKLFRRIEPMLPADSVLIDLGSGKGRALVCVRGTGNQGRR